jgi:hypothetical protein
VREVICGNEFLGYDSGSVVWVSELKIVVEERELNGKANGKDEKVKSS